LSQGGTILQSRSLGVSMSKPKDDPVQKAIKDLLTSPKVKRQVTAHRKTKDPPEISQAAINGNIRFLCEYLRQNPTCRIPQPIYQLIERLRFLYEKIESDAGDNYWDPAPTTEWLWVDGVLPVGTSNAAKQALVDLIRAWVEGLLWDHTVQRIPPKPTGKQAKKRGPKFKYDLDPPLEIAFEWMDEYLTEHWPKAQLKRGKTEDPQHFEAHAMEIVQTMHAEYGPSSKYSSGLPEKIARTIARQAMSGTQKIINPRNLICSLLAEYERDDPTKFKAIRQLISRQV
jgi:hypothetical protein